MDADTELNIEILRRFVSQITHALIQSGALPAETVDTIRTAYDRMAEQTLLPQKRAIAAGIADLCTLSLMETADRTPAVTGLRLVHDADHEGGQEP